MLSAPGFTAARIGHDGLGEDVALPAAHVGVVAAQLLDVVAHRGEPSLLGAQVGLLPRGVDAGGGHDGEEQAEDAEGQEEPAADRQAVQQVAMVRRASRGGSRCWSEALSAITRT